MPSLVTFCKRIGAGTLCILLLSAHQANSLANAASFVPPKSVAVTGATGKTGSLVVKELLRRNASVVALVRDQEKAEKLFSDTTSADKLKIIQCDLTDEKAIADAINGVDAAIWCATGFNNAPEAGIFEKLKRLLGATVMPKQQPIDTIGLPAIAQCFTGPVVNGDGINSAFPKVVMLSSAGVTRTQWDDETKQQFIGAADIPIVRLNPFGILDIKRESEEKLRKSGAPYCIVRPCGLNDNWPAESRPVFSQGDVACGRVNRADVANVLVDVLSLAEATGKTFEMIGLAGYPRPTTIATALSRLVTDKETISKESVLATYNTLQQLLPGEKQASADLAMGQTYEQLDRGETGRLGERGNEKVRAAGLTPS